MYISYMFNWLYKVMQIPVPLVLSNNVYALVTIFDIFMFTFYLGIFIVLIRFMVTNNLSFRVGGFSDFSYSPNFNIIKKGDTSLEADSSNENIKVYSNDSVGGRILNRKILLSSNPNKKTNLRVPKYYKVHSNNSINGRIFNRKILNEMKKGE